MKQNIFVTIARCGLPCCGPWLTAILEITVSSCVNGLLFAYFEYHGHELRCGYAKNGCVSPHPGMVDDHGPHARNAWTELYHQKSGRLCVRCFTLMGGDSLAISESELPEPVDIGSGD